MFQCFINIILNFISRIQTRDIKGENNSIIYNIDDHFISNMFTVLF